MTRILGAILALALVAVLVPQGAAPAEAAKKKAAPGVADDGKPYGAYLKYQLQPLGKERGPALKSRERMPQGTQPPDLISLRAVANQTPVLSRGPPAEPSAGRSRDKPRTLHQTCAATSALHRQRRIGGRPTRTVHRME